MELKLVYDMESSLTITAAPTVLGKMRGLCGNYDGNHTNEFQTFE